MSTSDSEPGRFPGEGYPEDPGGLRAYRGIRIDEPGDVWRLYLDTAFNQFIRLEPRDVVAWIERGRCTIVWVRLERPLAFVSVASPAELQMEFLTGEIADLRSSAVASPDLKLKPVCSRYPPCPTWSWPADDLLC